jgi:translation initiation factor 1
MSGICTTCGLPPDLCVCETIAKESQKLHVTTTKKKFGKISTLISGINQHEVDVKDIAKKLKAKFACGGTVKDGVIEIQGDHTKEVGGALAELGFSPDTIEFTKGPTKGRR